MTLLNIDFNDWAGSGNRTRIVSLEGWSSTIVPYPRQINLEGAGFEPAKAGPADLQSALVDRLSTPPKIDLCILPKHFAYSIKFFS